jgi:hypothetical protein
MRSDKNERSEVRGEAPAALLPEGALSPNNCRLSRGGNVRPPAFPRLFPNGLALQGSYFSIDLAERLV